MLNDLSEIPFEANYKSVITTSFSLSPGKTDVSFYRKLHFKWMQLKAASEEIKLNHYERAIEILRDEWNSDIDVQPEDPDSLLPIPMDAGEAVQEVRNFLLALSYAKKGQTDLAIELLQIMNRGAVTDYDKYLQMVLEVPFEFLDVFQEQAAEIERVLIDHQLLI